MTATLVVTAAGTPPATDTDAPAEASAAVGGSWVVLAALLGLILGGLRLGRDPRKVSTRVE